MPAKLINLPGTALRQFGQLRLLESPDIQLENIYQRLLDGSYKKPFIVDDGLMRYLYLGVAYVQSAMRMDHPDTLDLRYTQKMMAFLLFNRHPKRIAMLGLGGGSLAKFCYRQLPEADITAVEIDPDVIALRRYFAIPDDDGRFRVLQGDAAEFVTRPGAPIDVLLIDAFDATGLAHSLRATDFLSHAHAALNTSGILVMNLVGSKVRHASLLAQTSALFNHEAILVPVNGDAHHVLFAFKQPAHKPDWRRLRQEARQLKRVFGLEFPRFLQKMERASHDNLLNLVASWIKKLTSADKKKAHR